MCRARQFARATMTGDFFFYTAPIKNGDDLDESHVMRIPREIDTRNIYISILVGGLEHEFSIFPNSWDDDPIWLSYFSAWLKPPICILLMIYFMDVVYGRYTLT